MNHELLVGNLNRTLHTMKEQTGLEPGGPTGQCARVALGAISGRPIDFKNDITSFAAYVDERREHGVLDYVARVEGGITIAAIRSLLEQEVVPIDAVTVLGRRPTRTSCHEIAIFPDEGRAPYRIIDSLLPDATFMYDSPVKAGAFVDGRFEEILRLSVVPQVKERARRLREGQPLVSYIDVTDTITLIIPRIQRSSPM